MNTLKTTLLFWVFYPVEETVTLKVTTASHRALYFHVNACKHQTQPARLVENALKRWRQPVALSRHRSPIPALSLHHHHFHHCSTTPSPFIPSFCVSEALMLSVVNGLASCFKAAIAECKFWLLRFIYILVSWSLLYIWVVAMGWHNVNKK